LTCELEQKVNYLYELNPTSTELIDQNKRNPTIEDLAE